MSVNRFSKSNNFFMSLTLIVSVIAVLLIPSFSVFADAFADEQKIESYDADTVNFGLSASTSNDQFGNSVAAEGNYMLASAPNSDIGGGNRGVVAAYTYNGSQWLKKQELSGATNGDLFGWSVAMDGNLAVIGAPGYNKPAPSGITDAGAAYVYLRVSGNWVEIARLRASDWAASDSLGTSVAISGQTIVVGAYEDDDGEEDNGALTQEDEGSVYVFTPPSPYTTWANWYNAPSAFAEFTETAKLTSPVVQGAVNGGVRYYFGRAVAISGNTIAVGEAGQATANTDITGSVYVFVRPGSTWVNSNTPTATLTSTDIANDERFGWSLAFASNKIYVGTPFHDVNGATAGANQGAVFVYHKPAGPWVTTSSYDAKITNTFDIDGGDNFGYSVSVGNGATPFLAIGEVNGEKLSPATNNVGVAHMFKFDGAIWNFVQLLEPADGIANDDFGVALNVNDTAGNIVVGADLEDDGVTANTGSVYTFKYDTVSPRVTFVYDNNPDFFTDILGLPGTAPVSPVTNIPEGDYTNDAGIATLVVRFDEAMYNYNSADPQDVANTANYTLVKDGVTNIPVTAVTYAEDFDSNVGAPRYYALLTIDLNGAIGSPTMTDGVYVLTAQSTLEDRAGNQLRGDGTTEGTDFVRTFTVDLTDPSITKIDSDVTTGDNEVTEAELLPQNITKLLVVFNEDMKSSNAANLNNATNPANYTLVDGSASIITIDAVTYDNNGGVGPFVVTLDVNGGVPLPIETYTLTVNRRIHDLASNPLPTPNFVRNFEVVDSVAPTVTIDQDGAQVDPTNALPIVFDVVFSEAIDPLTFTTSDVTNSGTATVTAWSITNSGDDINFTLEATTVTTDGTVIPSLGIGSFTDAGANANTAASTAVSDGSVLYDTVAPTVTIDQDGAQADPTNTLPIVFDVVFSEAINPSTFTTSDIAQTGTATVTAWSITNSGDDTNFTLEATTVTTNGTVIPSLGIGTFADAATNANTAASTAVSDGSVLYDTAPPSVTIDQDGAQADPTNTLPIVFDVVFSEAIDTSTFTTGDITQTGTATGITWSITNSGDDINFTLEATAVTTDGTVVPSIGIATFADPGANVNTAASTAASDGSVTYDTTGPIVYVTGTFTVPADGAVIPGTEPLTVEFNEDLLADLSADAANNAANYRLVSSGGDGFQTTSCTSPTVGDTVVNVDNASYDNNGGVGPYVVTLDVNGGADLPHGEYRLFVCGTTSVTDLAGNELNDGLSDTAITFTVFVQRLPATGFPQGYETKLPAQPANLAYAATDMWLEIPKLGLKMNIVGVPQTAEGWNVTWLNRDAGWLNGSAFPTWEGNSVITAHVWDALNKPGPFSLLKDLKYGDQVMVHAFGQVFTYEIRESRSVLPTSFRTVFQEKEESWITLLTCEDYKERSENYSFRRMVRAVLISVKSE